MPPKTKPRIGLTKAEARKVMLSLKGTTEGLHFGKPAIFYRDAFVGRVHDREDAVVAIVSGIEMRDVMLEAEPELFYITDHYRNRPALLARLSTLTTATLKELMAARIREIEARPERKPRKVAVKKRVAKKTAKKPNKAS